MRITDESGTKTLTLLDKEAGQPTSVPSQKLLRELENGTMTQIHAAVKGIIGKMCAVQIKVSSYDITMNVTSKMRSALIFECSPIAIYKDNDNGSNNLQKKQNYA